MSFDCAPRVVMTALGPIAYRELRTGDGQGDTECSTERTNAPVVVAIHGAMGGHDQSGILARTVLPAGCRCIAISRPGYPGTPLKGRETPEAQADLVAALLKDLHIHRAILLAISGGGYSAIHFAVRHPEACHALILCSSTGGRNAVPIPFSFSILTALGRIPFVVRALQKRAGSNPERGLRRSVSHTDILDAMLGNERVMRLYNELTVGMLSDFAQRIPGTANDIRITKEREYPLESIHTPTLIVHGTDDRVVPYEHHGRKLAERIPDAQLCLADRGEHVTIFTHNDMVRAAVRQFLTTCPE